MSVRDLPPEETIALALEAIGDRAPERLRPLLLPGVRVVTGRAEHQGVDAALSWAGKGYEHLDRRFVIVRIESLGEGRLVHGRVEYVWRESGVVGDSTPVFIAFRFEEGLVAALSLHDTEEEARSALGA